MNDLSPADVHASAIVIDGHVDTAQRFVDEHWDFASDLGEGMLNLATARSGGLNAQFFAAWAEPREWRGRYAFRTLQLIDGVRQQIRKHPQDLRLCLTADEIEQAHRDGLFAVLLAIEGGHSIENDLGLLRSYFELGVRYMTLTWSNSNEWADSSGDIDDPAVPHHGGLTDFGRDVVREMNRLGMMVDISHVADATFRDVLRTTRAPVIASHSSARALNSSLRNLTDEQLLAIATNNGIVMVNFYPSFLDEGWRNTWSSTYVEREALQAAAAKPFRDRGEPMPYSIAMQVEREFYKREFHKRMILPRFEVLLDHFDHVARVAGIDHIGIGSDFDGFSLCPIGIETAAQLPRITEGLMRRGYTAEQMRKLLGGNLLRVMHEVQAEAQKL